MTCLLKNHLVLLEAQRCLTVCGLCPLPDTAVAFVRTQCGPLTDTEQCHDPSNLQALHSLTQCRMSA